MVTSTEQQCRCRRFENKVAVVTASTAGIGLATAVRLGQEGATVVISSRKQSSVDSALQHLRSLGIKCSGIECHVGVDEHRAALLKHVKQEYGRIDVLVLNAAVNPSLGPLVSTPSSSIAKILKINIQAALQLVTEAAPLLPKAPASPSSGGAAILFVTSITAFRPSPPLSAYAVSKTALLGAVKALAGELGPQGVRVNGIAPGIVPTNFSSVLVEKPEYRKAQEDETMLGRLGTPEDIAAAAAFLVSDDAAYVTGETLVVAGGMQSRL